MFSRFITAHVNFDSVVGCNSLFFPRDPLAIFWFTYKLISIKEAHNSQHSRKHPINVLSITVIFRFSLLLCLLLWITLAYASFPLWALAPFSCRSNTQQYLYMCEVSTVCGKSISPPAHTSHVIRVDNNHAMVPSETHEQPLQKIHSPADMQAMLKYEAMLANVCDLQLPREYVKTSPFTSMRKAAAEGQVFTSNLQPLICFVCLDQG